MKISLRDFRRTNKQEDREMRINSKNFSVKIEEEISESGTRKKAKEGV